MLSCIWKQQGWVIPSSINESFSSQIPNKCEEEQVKSTLVDLQKQVRFIVTTITQKDMLLSMLATQPTSVILCLLTSALHANTLNSLCPYFLVPGKFTSLGLWHLLVPLPCLHFLLYIVFYCRDVLLNRTLTLL